jgi:saccharopepsin
MFHVGDQSWNQTFMAANETSWAFIPGDGFLGMAFSTIAVPRTEVVVETMIREGILDAPKFAIYYGKEFVDTGDKPGEGAITLGASEEDKYVDGDMTWLPVRKDNNGTVYQLWRSTLREVRGYLTKGDSAAVGEQQQHQPLNISYPPGRANAVFDTGAGVFSVPEAVLDPLYKAIGWPGADALVGGKFMPLCSYFNATWAVDFAFSDDGVNFTNLTLTGDQFLGTKGFAGRQDACEPPFSSSGGDSLYLFGQNVLRQAYTVFDFGATKVENYKPRIGWGKLRNEYVA